ncbi:MAG: hypothetical protein WD646_05280 [Actinomycetota bacterium]
MLTVLFVLVVFPQAGIPLLRPFLVERAATFTVLVWTQLLHVFSARWIGGSVVTRISPLRLIAYIRANSRCSASDPFTAAQWMVVTVASAVGELLVAALPSFSGRRRTAEAGPQ